MGSISSLGFGMIIPLILEISIHSLNSYSKNVEFFFEQNNRSKDRFIKRYQKLLTIDGLFNRVRDAPE